MGFRLIQVPYDSGYRDRRMGRGPARLVEAGAVERLSAASVRSCLRFIAPRGPILGCTLSAFDPARDTDGRAAATAVELLGCLAERVESG